MTTLTPSQYEALPEDQREYWEPMTFDKVTISTRGCDNPKYITYTPVMIPLSEANRIINEAITFILQGKNSNPKTELQLF